MTLSLPGVPSVHGSLRFAPAAWLRVLAVFAFLSLAACASTRPASEIESWEATARRVTITRDGWGVAHVRGRTDADAVFGMIYAQAEDDFPRIEANYLTALGRTAEAEGEAAIWRDLRTKLYMQPEDLQARYQASPGWLQKLMDAWAAGLNYYLATHPEVQPRVIRRFEPWMALSFTEGSISRDIDRISLRDLEAFYAAPEKALASVAAAETADELGGSNGFAIAPSRTRDGHALLLINPHTSFFFRSELQMASDEGLNAYGAVTWGQMFVYQGFNEKIGWMHTSSGVDAVDEFLETIVRKDGGLFYRYGEEERPVVTRSLTVPYRAEDGSMKSRSFTTYHTHHGPIVRSEGGKWVAFAMMHKPSEALQQSFLRTKSRDFDSFMRVARLQANSSNNTVFADSSGDIAYLHPQFIPKRDDRFDYSRPVDGSDPATDWRGLHPLEDTPRVLNPATGWIQNTNNWPYSAAGADSPRAAGQPRYMDRYGENPRGVNATRLLSAKTDFTLETLKDAAYDSYLPAFADLIPGLTTAYDRLPASDPLVSSLAEPVRLLKQWDYRWNVNSVPTSVAVYWGNELFKRAPKGANPSRMSEFLGELDRKLTDQDKLGALSSAVAKLQTDFGDWRTPWGEINRYQRQNGDITQTYSDSAPSLPVGFTSGNWGSLAVFGTRSSRETKRLYGFTGNSFVAVVELGPRVRARAVSVGGGSNDPASPHFDDQAAIYAAGELREVRFYPSDIAADAKRTYRPGVR